MAIDVAPEQRTPLNRVRTAYFRLFVRYTEIRRRLGFVLLGSVRRRRRFRFGERDYSYFVARYNETWSNERAVELSIVISRLGDLRQGEFLEIGRVLDHYIDRPHDVVDKYELAPGVTNQDVLDFATDKRYDLIVSISTLEHVGFDEDIRDPDKPARAVKHLTGLLRPGGELLVTVPLGYNAEFDGRLRSGVLGFDEVRYLKRMSRSNRWRETSAAEVANSRYGAPYREGNAIAVAVIRRSESAGVAPPSRSAPAGIR